MAKKGKKYQEAANKVDRTKYYSVEEAIKLANDSIYGLAGAVFTKDIGKAQRVANKLKLGTVWINDFHPYFAQAPWGGYKQSGVGRENGISTLSHYTRIKSVQVELGDYQSIF